MKHMRMLLCLLFPLITLDVSANNDAANWFDQAFDLKVLACERVGDNLVADIEVTNKTQQDISKLFFSGESVYAMCEDASGRKYYSSFRIDRGPWSGTSPGDGVSASIASRSSKVVTIRIEDFDPRKSSQYVTLRFMAKCPQLSKEKATIRIPLVLVRDNYIKASGFQTNDRGLEYKLLGSSVKTEYNISLMKKVPFVYIRFSVTNRTGYNIPDLKLHPGKAYDASGNEYYRNCLSIGSGDFGGMGENVTTSLANGQSITVTVRIEQLPGHAAAIRHGYVSCRSYTVQMEDVAAKFSFQ